MLSSALGAVFVYLRDIVFFGTLSYGTLIASGILLVRLISATVIGILLVKGISAALDKTGLLKGFPCTKKIEA